MSHTRTDLTIHRGGTFLRTINWRSSNQTVVDLTGYAAQMQIRRHANSKQAVITLSTDSSLGGGITINTADSSFNISLTATQTAALPDIVGVYDFEATSPSGEVLRLLSGTVTISPDVTR